MSVERPLEEEKRGFTLWGWKALYKLQGFILNLNLTGPLTGLWTDLMDSSNKISREEVILLIRGSFSWWQVSSMQERRQISWSRLNPVIKDISMEDSKEKNAILFGDKFIKKATKRIEEETALVKQTSSPRVTSTQTPKVYTGPYWLCNSGFNCGLDCTLLVVVFPAAGAPFSKKTTQTPPGLNSCQDHPGNSQESSLEEQLYQTVR